MKISPIITLAASAALLTGCAASPDTTEQRASKEPSGSPMADTERSTGSAPAPNASTDPGHTQTKAASKDPMEVGKKFVAAAYTWDTQTNTDLTAALKRVEYMATDELAAQFVAPQDTTEGAVWDQAARNRAHTEPKVTLVPEANQALMSSRRGTKKAAYTVTWKWAGPGGYERDGGKDLVILTLEETQQGWKVASFQPTPLQHR